MYSVINHNNKKRKIQKENKEIARNHIQKYVDEILWVFRNGKYFTLRAFLVGQRYSRL